MCDPLSLPSNRQLDTGTSSVRPDKPLEVSQCYLLQSVTCWEWLEVCVLVNNPLCVFCADTHVMGVLISKLDL